MNTAARNPGLDSLRALAIGLVFAYHYRVFVSGADTFGWASGLGWTGVDLFFVLSGTLIGGPLFAGLLQGRRLHLGAFWARRALRTWPAYAVMVGLYFGLPGQLGGRTPPPLWRFLTFTQNWQLQPGTAFSHAWSLCIEEQFYLVLPLAALAAAGLAARLPGRLRLAHAWGGLATLTAVGITARFVLWCRYGPEAFGEVDGYYPAVYYATLTRFDELLPGLALGLLRHGHPAAWAALMARGRQVLGVSLLALAALGWGVLNRYYRDAQGYFFFMSVFGYSLIAWAFAGLVAAALSPATALARVQVPGAAMLARGAYAVYLTHKAVDFLVARAARAHGWPDSLRLLLILLGSAAAAWLLHVAVERPFMRARERWVGPMFAGGAAPARAG